MDWTAIAASVVTFILGIAAVSKFLGKILPQTAKYVSIAKDALALADDLIAALEDGAISPEETSTFKTDLARIKDDFAK